MYYTIELCTHVSLLQVSLDLASGCTVVVNPFDLIPLTALAAIDLSLQDGVGSC